MNTKTSNQPEKIAVLGSGFSAMSCVFEITDQENWQEKYDITVYQIGWRLGGKAATGRNRKICDRIEARGMHMLWGYEENVLRMMRKLYEELGRDQDLPLSSFLDGKNPAFYQYDYVDFADFLHGRYRPHSEKYDRNDARPGTDDELPPFENIMAKLIELITVHEKGHEGEEIITLEDIYKLMDTKKYRKIKRTWNFLKWIAYSKKRKRIYRFWDFMEKIINAIIRIFNSNAAITERIGYSIVKGIIGDWDLLMDNGWLGIDDWDLKNWLLKYGAGYAINTPLVEMMYGSACADDQKVAAGVVLNMTIRGLLLYKGSVIYQFNSDTGEAVFAPFYDVLKKRGVKFKFFHRVSDLILSEDKKNIAKIKIAKQVELKNDDYYPFYEVKKLACWPNCPLYDQIVDGDKYKHLDLELYDGNPYEKFIDLELGKDFDRVVLGISVGAFKDICSELVDDADNPKFNNMVENTKTTELIHIQAWLKPDLKGLGSKINHAPNLNQYTIPLHWNILNSWYDLSHQLKFENWDSLSDAERPHSRANISGTTHDQCDAQGWRLSLDFLCNNVNYIWPKIVDKNNPRSAIPGTGIDWSYLVAPSELKGEERMYYQFLSVVLNPSDRYVQPLAGCSKFRLYANDSGYDNLILTGDWVKSDTAMGCMEEAVKNGLQAANAVLGRKRYYGIVE